MNTPLKVLLIEDTESDAGLVLYHLKKAGYQVTFKRVETIKAINECLDGEKWDVVISDYNLPGFDAGASLALFKEKKLEIPFIVVSGAMGEETAVRVMKLGANDYLLKDNLAKLPLIVKREMDDIFNRHERKQKELEIRKLEEAKSETEKKYQLLFERNLSGIYRSTLSGKILDCNNAFAHMLGFNSARELMTIHASELYFENDDRESFFKLVREKKILTNHESRARKKNGEPVYFIENISLVDDGENDDPIIEGIMVDVTERYLAEQNLNRLNKELAEQNRQLQQALHEKDAANTEKIRAEQAAIAKTEFLSIMSHEIRTPLNGVIGIANLLMEENMAEAHKEYIRVLNFSASHLATVVSDILDFSKIESGNIHFEKIPFNLHQVCTDVFNLFKNNADEKNISYTFLATPIPYQVKGDYVRLSQVISNLLSNAIKFTDKGSVDLNYKIVNENSNECTVHFSVRDTGIGISEKQLERIFDSFSQADESINRNYGGTGLGLSISKKLTEMQGGSIKVESAYGRGSAFTVELHFEKSVETGKETGSYQNRKTDYKELSGLKVLIAEDNRINSLILREFLKRWNVESEWAKDGKEAIGMLGKDQFDMVLMDLQMPIMNGLEAIMFIRQSGNVKLQQIPIIALTADANLETKNVLLQNGFNDYMTKPFNPDALYQLLNKHRKKPVSGN